MFEVGPDGTPRLTRTWVIFFERLGLSDEQIQEDAAGGGGVPAIGWDIQDSSPSSDASDPVIPVEEIAVGTCRVRIKETDLVNPLEFDITVNGTSIFATHPTIAAGTSTRDVQVFTGFAGDVTILPDDDLRMVIVTGGDWEVAIYLVAA